MKVRRPDTHDLDLDAVDGWAVNLVVKEGVYMNLNYTERVVAVGMMKERGFRAPEMAERLRCPIVDVYNMERRLSRLAKLQQ